MDGLEEVDEETETLTEKNFWSKNKQWLACIVAWILSLITGATMIHIKKFDQRTVSSLGLIGDLFSRMLKCLGMPFFLLNAMASFAKIEFRHAIQYFIATMMVFCMSMTLVTTTAIVSAFLITPGRDIEVMDAESISGLVIQDAILDVIRDFFPENVVSCTVYSHGTVLISPDITTHNITDESGNQVVSISKYAWDFKPNPRSPGGNFKGLLIAAIVFGLCLSYKTHHQRFVYLLDKLLMLMIACIKPITYIAPVGIFFGQLASILEVDPEDFERVFWLQFTYTMLTLVSIVGIYPVLYLIALKKPPFMMILFTLPAITYACGTRSSYASFPLSYLILTEQCKLSPISVGVTLPFAVFFHIPGSSGIIMLKNIYLSQIGNAKILRLQTLLVMLPVIILCNLAIKPIAGYSVNSWIDIVSNLLDLPLRSGEYFDEAEVIIDMLATTLTVVGDMYATVLVDKIMEKRIAIDKQLQSQYILERT